MTRITVAVRTRPTSSFADDVIKIQSDNRGIVVDLPRNAHADEYINNQSGSFSWNFDAVLHNASQDVVYERVAAPAVHDSLKGINGTVLMYGQTGSGKTYTCIGDMGNFKYRGIVPRALADVYSFIEAHPENEVQGLTHLGSGNGNSRVDLLASGKVF
ncbi:P-loop containing nucleoside triphosphate hydrolase protein [Pavlovales sp. CCMP2436]|nr:P-loop containing nucleoside triphosphate hydrolase protein [Pavlovales sp. CCMP2436]